MSQVKAPATKPEGLNSIPRTHMMAEENIHLTFMNMCDMCEPVTYIYRYAHVKMSKYI